MKGRFVKGPIPWTWLSKAAHLPRAALVVALAIWFLRGLTKAGKGGIKLRPSLLNELGLDRKAGYRGLKALETAGLVSVERRRGASPKVTVLFPDKR